MTWSEWEPEEIPAESEDGEGEHDPCCPVRHGVEGAEGEPHPALTRGHRVGDVHGRDGLHEERDDQVRDGDVGEQEVGGALLEVVMVSDGAHYHKVAEYPNKGQCHLQKDCEYLR